MDEKEDFIKAILTEYKEGFSEIVGLVEQFDNVSDKTANSFLQSRQNVLNRNINYVKNQQEDIFSEIRCFLAIKNSELYQLRRIEEQLMKESEECKQTRQKLDKQIKEIEGAVENKKSAISGH